LTGMFTGVGVGAEAAVGFSAGALGGVDAIPGLAEASSADFGDDVLRGGKILV
jgi:hypothetical protein